jgi:GT2 family glycosyltransferase
MESAQPKVSIVTITFHQTKVTMEFLESLRHISYKNIEVIVVDNGPDDTSHQIADKYPEVIYLPSKENLGFSGGNNLGIKACTGDFILLINNDTEVDPGFLEPMVQVFKDYPDAGLVSSKLIYFNSDNIIQYAGSISINKYTGRGKRRGFMEKDLGQYNKIMPSAFCHGASMMFSREVYDKIGGLAEEYFVYYEEIDYSESVKRAGYKIYYCGYSNVYHKESVTLGKESPWKTFLMTRNRMLYIRKFYKGEELLLASLFYYLVACPKNILLQLLKGRMDNVRSIIWAVSGRSKY